MGDLPRGLYRIVQELHHVDARGEQTDSGFLVLEDSHIRKNPNPHFFERRKAAAALRERLLAKGSMTDCGDYYELRKVQAFKSPSSAASFVLGTDISKEAWRQIEVLPAASEEPSGSHRAAVDSGSEGVLHDVPRSDDREETKKAIGGQHPGRGGYPQEKIDRVLERVAKGESKAAIAREEGITTPTIYNWVKRYGTDSARLETTEQHDDEPASTQGPDKEVLDLARDLIDGATQVYLREQPRYDQLVGDLKQDLMEILAFSGVRALLQARSKDATSLQVKLLRKLSNDDTKRPSDVRKKMLDIAGTPPDEIGLARSPHIELLNSVPDLAAARIQVFHPDDRPDLTKCIGGMLPRTGRYKFDDQTDWESRDESSKASGKYRATHITGTSTKAGSEGSRFEIQVAGLLDSVMNEFSHEYAYKNARQDGREQSADALVELEKALLPAGAAIQMLLATDELPAEPFGGDLKYKVEHLVDFVKGRAQGQQGGIEARCALRRWSLALQRGLSDWDQSVPLEAVFPIRGLPTDFLEEKAGIRLYLLDGGARTTFDEMEPKIVVFYLLAGTSELEAFGAESKTKWGRLAQRLAGYIDDYKVLPALP